MEQDTKITYSVIAGLVVVLGVTAYFLQGALSYPQPTVITDTTIKTTAQPIKPQTQTMPTNPTSSTTMTIPENVTSAVITTNMGDITVVFATTTPETVKNFTKLAASHFYDGTRFHRVMRDFMIQGGDPLSKDVTKKDMWGTGGPGYTFKDETSPTDQFKQGVLAMANAGANTNGSQFFIVTSIAGTPWLTGKHTIFGHVTSGLDVALRIQDLQVDGSNRPLQDVIVEKIELK